MFSIIQKGIFKRVIEQSDPTKKNLTDVALLGMSLILVTKFYVRTWADDGRSNLQDQIIGFVEEKGSCLNFVYCFAEKNGAALAP